MSHESVAQMLRTWQCSVSNRDLLFMALVAACGRIAGDAVIPGNGDKLFGDMH